jgi:hypothetical protein
VYFRCSPADFQAITDAAIENLKTAVKVVAAIKSRNIKTYQEIATKFGNCPQDNELESVDIWNLQTNLDKIKALENSKDTSWYYRILNNLIRNI